MFSRARVIFLVLTLTACGANTLTKPAAEQAIPRPAPGKAQIVFLRPSTYFPGMLTYLYEVGANKDSSLARSAARTRSSTMSRPGSACSCPTWPS